MKKILLAGIALTMLFAGCNQSELKKLNEEKQKLIQETTSKDSTINALITSFNEIQDNLSTIKEKENLIEVKTKQAGEFKEDARERIKEDIQLINELMAKNKSKLEDLNRKMKKSGVKIKSLETMIAGLTQKIEEKDSEINALKEQLVNMNFTVASLNSSIDTLKQEGSRKSDVIAQQKNELNTAYYIIGTSSDLKERGIVTKEGGFIGIGGAKKLSQNFKSDAFTKIDITKVGSIEIGGRKAKLITTHQGDSYKLDPTNKKADRLIIKDYNSFWSASKYLVILVD